MTTNNTSWMKERHDMHAHMVVIKDKFLSRINFYIFIGMLLYFWTYRDYPLLPVIWLIIGFINFVVGHIIHSLHDSDQKYEFLNYTVWLFFGGQIVLYMIAVKSTVLILMGYLN